MGRDINATSAGGGLFGLGDDPETARVVIVPVPFEATVSYGSGTSAGPHAIVSASDQLDLDHPVLGRFDESGIAMLQVDAEIENLNEEALLSAKKVIQARETDANEPRIDGALQKVNRLTAEVHARVFESVSRALERGQIVGTVGGDHSCALGPIRAHAERFGPLGVLQFDAHADLRSAYQGFVHSHASVMRCVLDDVPNVRKLVQVAVRDFCPEEREVIESDDRVETFFDAEIARARLEGRLGEVWDRVVDALPAAVYVSFDIDGLDPKLCPGTGTPVPGGIDFNEAWLLLEKLIESGRRIVGFDLCEVGSGGWDGNVGARVLFELIGWTIASQRLRSKGAGSTT